MRQRFYFHFLGLFGSLIALGDTVNKLSDSVNPNEFHRQETSHSLPLEQATKFNQFLQGQLDPSLRALYISKCRVKPVHDPFCFSVNRQSQLFRYKNKFYEISLPRQKKRRSPAVIKFSNGKLQELRRMRKTSLYPLMKGLEKRSKEELISAAQSALKITLCPNRLSIAVAATLEEHLPSQDVIELIAQNYVHGTKCLSRRSSKRNHYLTRAGIIYYRLGLYQKALEALKKTLSRNAFIGRSLYWKYRTEKKVGQIQKAQTSMKKLIEAHPFSFHTILAALENDLSLKELIITNPPSPKRRSSKYTKYNTLITQMELLHKKGYLESSGILFSWYRKMAKKVESEVLIYALSLTDNTTKVSTLPLLFIRKKELINPETLKMMFPRAFEAIFKKYKKPNTPLHLLTSLTHRESKFRPWAVSPANAQGLMQIIPPTAKRLAGYDVAFLTDTDLNVRLGSQYVSELLDMWSGMIPLALTSYNAGEHRTEKWIKRYGTHDLVFYSDMVPFKETRHYVATVLRNYYWYERLYNNSDKAFRNAVGLSQKPTLKTHRKNSSFSK